MKALDRLRKSGLSNSQIASAVGCSDHLIRLYGRGMRFPSKKNFTCIVELAEARGLLLLARDFIGASDQCEADEPAPSRR